MTPTTSEREALVAAAEEIESGHAWISREAASVIIRKHAAALTREQREPQQEAPGAVRPDYRGMRERAIENGLQLRSLDEIHAEIDGATQPAPVDVRVPLEVFSAGEWRYSETGQTFTAADLDEAAFVAYRALLDGQPAGVFKACSCVTERQRELCAHKHECTDTVALGGGGGRG